MNEREDRRRYTRCSFCGKGQDQVRKLVAGPGVFICDQCIDLCQEVLEDDNRSAGTKKQKTGFIPNPKTICAALDQYVIGQERAKKVLSVQVYNHYKRISASKSVGDVELTKSNVLLVGPTGCGKTYLAQTLAKILDVPFAIADATSLTEAGYVGEDVENILLRLIQAADFDISRAERGIIYIDKVVEQRIGRRAIGFGAPHTKVERKAVSETLKHMQPQDLLKYGFIPEFIGRLPIIVTLHHLDQQDIVRILTEPKNALVKQYQKFFSLDNVELVFQKGSLDAIAELALLRGTGARALKSIIEEALLNSMFEIPSRPEIKRCIISERSIRDALEPEFEVAEETEGPARAVGESA